MVLIAEAIKLADFLRRTFGLSEEQAREAADVALAEVDRLRALGSPTASTEAALAEVPAKPLPPRVPEPDPEDPA